jgi:hypothetical protein
MYKSMGRDIDPDATVDLHPKGDYGADPMGDGMFKMVPSGDIVNREEKERRLSKYHPKESLAKRLFGLTEGSLGRLSGDASDILTGIVHKNKGRSEKEILDLVIQELGDEIKGLPDGEILTSIEDVMRFANLFGVGSNMPRKEHVKIEVEDFKMNKAKELIKLVEYEVTGNLEELKKEAMEAAEFRGHEMGPWEQEGSNQATSTCSVCGKTVTANAAPAPNDIDIGGGAVALNCKE